MKRKLPIGIQGFEGLRNDGYIYVDKTAYLYQLAHEGKPYFLSRPRRFGKSLLLSTMKAYWEGKRELFEGLKIAELESDNPDAWKSYPVFYFDFNGVNYQETGALEESLNIQLKRWESNYGCKSENSTLSERFQNLLLAAREQTGLRCVILVDEYDKPLLDVIENKALQEHNKEVFKGFFSTLKSFDEYIQFIFITGVSKFHKVSIFSDLNQLRDISINEEYSGICGITEDETGENFHEEIVAFAKRRDMTIQECRDALKKQYDGYRFHQAGESVYNPFSLLSALEDQEFGSYWVATGTPTFLVRKLRIERFDVRSFTDHTIYADESTLKDYTGDSLDAVPLLYQTGYLTIVDADAATGQLTLGFPNDEVKYGFLESLLPMYAPDAIASGNDIFSLHNCIKRGDTEEMKDILMSLLATLPYSSGKTPFEQYFEIAVYLIFTLLGKITKSEVHSAKGRADCIVETQDFVYLFEFKLDKSADEALAQIEEKQYALPYAADARKLYKIGVNFDSKERNITEWKVRK